MRILVYFRDLCIHITKLHATVFVTGVVIHKKTKYQPEIVLYLTTCCYKIFMDIVYVEILQLQL